MGHKSPTTFLPHYFSASYKMSRKRNCPFSGQCLFHFPTSFPPAHFPFFILRAVTYFYISVKKYAAGETGPGTSTTRYYRTIINKGKNGASGSDGLPVPPNARSFYHKSYRGLCLHSLVLKKIRIPDSSFPWLNRLYYRPAGSPLRPQAPLSIANLVLTPKLLLRLPSARSFDPG